MVSSGAGWGGDATYLLAASHLDRTSLVLTEVGWLRPSTSGFGNPGSFHVPSLGRTVADPGCERYEGLLQELTDGSTICRFDYAPQVTVLPDERRTQVFGRLDWSWGETSEAWAELGYARNDISRDVSPSFPVLNTPRVPADHPGNPFGEDVWFQGRPYGYGQPPELNYYEHDTARFAVGLEGAFSAATSWELAMVHAVNDAVLNPRDVIAANFQASLLGLGGAGCDPGPADSVPAVAGQGRCRYFNPFSTAFAASPGDSLFNAPDLRSFIIGDYLGDGESRLSTFEANVTGFLPGYRGGYAVGVQYRKQHLEYAFDEVTRTDGFAFLIGNPDFSARDDVTAAYAELWLPVGERFEATGAVRYEDYGGGVGDTLDPKLTLLLRANEAFSLRGSFSTSFRAPSPLQTRGAQTNFTNILDHDGSRTFAGTADRRRGVPRTPETSRAFNVGITWRGRRATWAVNADYWRYAFRDVLRKDNAQAIVNADPFDPRIERTSAGTISIVNVAFINADRIETAGIDLSFRMESDMSFGTVTAWGEATWLERYDVTNAGVDVDGLGKLNRANVGAPNQRLQGVAGLSWSRDAYRVTAMARHVGSYEDDAGGDIERFTTLDCNVRWSLGEILRQGTDAWIALGGVNLLDEAPPFVNIAGSYDPRSADPRGRRLFVSVGWRL